MEFCKGCGKKVQEGEDVVKVELNERGKQVVWGVLHKTCFGFMVKDPRIIVESLEQNEAKVKQESEK